MYTGSIADNPNKFKTLTSTPAFFVYVGSATFTMCDAVAALASARAQRCARRSSPTRDHVVLIRVPHLLLLPPALCLARCRRRRIVCVCCIWGKGVAPPPRTQPPPAKLKPSKSMGGDQQDAPSRTTSLMHGSSRPQLTIEVATPPVERDTAVGTDATSQADAPKPGAEPVKTAPARWPTNFFNFG